MAQVKRIMISLPDHLLKEVDNIASQDNINRSEFIREAMRLYILERNRKILRDQMKKGYIEMANINLSLALEGRSVEDEVTAFFEPPKAEGE